MMLRDVQAAIQTIIAPVVMVTACAILIGGMLTQYQQINDRLRAFARERLELLRTPDGSVARVADLTGAYAQERLREIDVQVPRLLRRHQMVHNAVLAMYCAVLLFVVSMFAIAGAYANTSSALATLALAIFLAGMAAMLVGVGLLAVNIISSNVSVQYEIRRVLGLGK